MSKLTQHVYYDENEDRIYVIDFHKHQSFGIWYYPAHGFHWIGEL